MCKINLSLDSVECMRNNDINTYSIRSINYILRNYFLYARFLYDCIIVKSDEILIIAIIGNWNDLLNYINF